MSFIAKLFPVKQTSKPKDRTDLINTKLKSSETPDILKNIDMLSDEIVNDLINEFDVLLTMKPNASSYLADVRYILKCYAFNSDIKLVTQITSTYMSKIEALLIARGFAVESVGYQLIIKL